MPYDLVDCVPSDHGARPALSSGVGYLLLAGPGSARNRGLFLTDAEVALSKQVRAVPPATTAALRAAERYPPALALARDYVAGSQSGDSAASDAASCDVYTAQLEEHMRSQPDAPFLFVEAKGDDVGYLTRGEFYWVLRFLRGTKTVRWVSADYFIYENPVDDFSLCDAQLDRLLVPFPRAI